MKKTTVAEQLSLFNLPRTEYMTKKNGGMRLLAELHEITEPPKQLMIRKQND